MANRLKLSNERLERTYTYHTSYTSSCLKPSAQGLKEGGGVLTLYTEVASLDGGGFFERDSGEKTSGQPEV